MDRSGNTRRPLMRDVAQLAGVSAQTVSRVVSGSSAVKPETAQKVHQAIDLLGYEPNYAAQTLASGRSRSIGVLTIGHIFLGLSKTFVELELSQRQRGRYVLSASAPKINPESVNEALSYLRSQAVLAIVVISQNADILSRINLPMDIPIVLVMSGRYHIAGASTIALEQSLGATSIARHFMDSGWTKIVHIAANDCHQDAVSRRDAFAAELGTAGIVPEVRYANGWNPQDAYRCFSSYLDANPLPEAIFTSNDFLAVGVMRACGERGWKAGEDYALAGFDDSPVSAYLNPPLTTVTQDYTALAEAVSAQIDAALGGGGLRNEQVPTQLIVRESSAHPLRQQLP